MKTSESDADFQKSYHSTIFTNVYYQNLWGGEKGEFYSGPGSHNDLINEYADLVADFIQKNNLRKLVEIGCGDFNVTKTLLDRLTTSNIDFDYVGYDVVKPLITLNRTLYGSPNVKFVYKDPCVDTIKKGDVLIIRQVLQHLSNDSILRIVKKFSNYQYIIVTEHQASEKYGNLIMPNQDQESGASVRLVKNSGVYLEKEPFNCVIESLLFSIPEYVLHVEASINTYLIKGKR